MVFCDQKIYQEAPNSDIKIYDCAGNSIINIDPNGVLTRTTPTTAIGTVPLVPIDPYYVPECDNLDSVEVTHKIEP